MAKFMIVVSLHDTSPTRLKTAIQALNSILKSISDKDPEPAFRSMNADVFGFCIISSKTAQDILGSVMRATHHDGYMKNAPILDGRDNVIVLELHEGLAASGFTRLTTWLKRYRG